MKGCISKFGKSFLQDLDNSIPSWLLLSRYGKSQLLRSSYIWFFLVPIMAKLFYGINTEEPIHLFGRSFSLAFQLPFSWIMFYFASVTFAIASGIYSFKCPLMIQQYSTYSDYTAEGRSEQQLRNEMIGICFNKTFNRGIFRRLSSIDVEAKVGGYAKKFITEYCLDKSDNIISGNLLVIRKEIETAYVPQSTFQNAFWYIHNILNKSASLSRLIILILYVLGFICIAFVLSQNFFYVLNVI